MDYVLGFTFNYSLEDILLIKKERPEEQKGRLNGLGGKVEPGEHYHDAMVRELKEEAGINVTFRCFGKLRGPGWVIYLFVAATDEIYNRRQLTDENLEIVPLDMLNQISPWHIMPNLRWLIPMSIHALETESYFTIEQ